MRSNGGGGGVVSALSRARKPQPKVNAEVVQTPKVPESPAAAWEEEQEEIRLKTMGKKIKIRLKPPWDTVNPPTPHALV